MTQHRECDGVQSGVKAQPTHEPSPAGASQGRKSPIRRTKLKRWCFRLLAVCLSLSIVALVEAVFVLCGVGRDLSLVVAVPDAPQALRHQLNPAADRPYFGRHEIAGPEPRRFDLPRPDGVFRIVVVGGSTVLGFPYPAELAFPRQLEVLLKLQAPDREFEVLNAGIVSINSFSVADVVEQAVAAQPDLVIVHTGHNEFYGPGGAASTVFVAPPRLYPLTVSLRRTRLYQLLSVGFEDDESQPQPHLLESLPRSVQVPFEGPAFRQAERNYRANLVRIAETALPANIPLVLTTVASNDGGLSPVSFLIPTELDAERLQQWQADFDAGRQLAAEQSWQPALERFGQASAISGNSSLLFYRKGQCLQALSRTAEARTAFEQARDLDGCRLRAPGSFRKIVRDVAERFENDGVLFVDVAEQLHAEPGAEIADEDLFLEHVHYSLKGHRLVASILARCVQTRVLEREWQTSREPADSKLDELLGILPEDHIAGLSAALRVMHVFPMTETFDAALHQAALVSQIQAEYTQLDAGRQEVFADLSLDDMALRLPEALADHYRSAGDRDRELFYRRCDALRKPWDAEVRFRLARCLAEFDRERSEALEHCRRALELSPQHADARRLAAELQDNGRDRPASK